VRPVLFIFLVFFVFSYYVSLRSLFCFVMLRISHKTLFGSSLPPVLFTLFAFCLRIVMSNTYCVAFCVLFVFVLCIQCCQFLWIVHSWLAFCYSLTFIIRNGIILNFIHTTIYLPDTEIGIYIMLVLWTIASTIDYILDGVSRGRHRMVIGFTTTCAISTYHH
jgi:hypothetical protein